MGDFGLDFPAEGSVCGPPLVLHGSSWCRSKPKLLVTAPKILILLSTLLVVGVGVSRYGQRHIPNFACGMRSCSKMHCPCNRVTVSISSRRQF